MVQDIMFFLVRKIDHSPSPRDAGRDGARAVPTESPRRISPKGEQERRLKKQEQ